MARILGGIAVSHTPTIGFAVAHHKQQDPAWSPIFQSFEPLQRWLGTVPKMTLIARPRTGGAISNRTFIPRRCHTSIGVFGAVSVASACLIEG